MSTGAIERMFLSLERRDLPASLKASQLSVQNHNVTAHAHCTYHSFSVAYSHCSIHNHLHCPIAPGCFWIKHYCPWDFLPHPSLVVVIKLDKTGFPAHPILTQHRFFCEMQLERVNVIKSRKLQPGQIEFLRFNAHCPLQVHLS